MSEEVKDFIDKVLAEQERQIELWGEQEHEPYKWLSITIEEVGEVAKCLHSGYPIKMLLDELIQVCAVIKTWYEFMEKHSLWGDRADLEPED